MFVQRLLGWVMVGSLASTFTISHLSVPSAGASNAPVANAWYVAGSGIDANDCASAATPCATINAAIARAASGDVIRVAAGTYTGAGPAVVVLDRDVVLSGGWDSAFAAQSGLATIDGQSARTGIVTYGGVTARVESFVVKNGNSSSFPGYGGGITVWENGSLALHASLVTGNFSGGILNQGTLTVTGSTISHNVSLWSGGGIYTAGSASITDSRVWHNIGPADLADGQFGITSAGGGGIANVVALTLTRSAVTQNASCGAVCAGAGIYSLGELLIDDSAIAHNRGSYRGGGLYAVGSLRLTNSTLTHNSAEFGAGLWTRDDTPVALFNTSLTNNTAFSANGGLMLEASAPFFDPPSVTLTHTLIAENTGGGLPADCAGRLNSGGFNLLGLASGCVFTPTTGDLLDTAPLLLHPSGTVPVVPLDQGSPALDAGDPAGCRDALGAVLTRDQRGGLRPMDGDGDSVDRCDIGAFERAPDEQLHYAFMPLVRRPPPACSSGICGRVTRYGLAAPDVMLYLRHFDGGVWSTQATTLTGPDGAFSFDGMPGLLPGQIYYVLYVSPTGDLLWATRELDQYTAGSPAAIGEFDLAFVRIVEPYATNIPVSLPYTFWWQTRAATPSDNYEFNLFDPADASPYYYSPLLGYGSSYTLTTLPAGFDTNVFYEVEIWVYSPDGGMGLSLGKTVSFLNAGQGLSAEAATGPERSAALAGPDSRAHGHRLTDPLFVGH